MNVKADIVCGRCPYFTYESNNCKYKQNFEEKEMWKPLEGQEGIPYKDRKMVRRIAIYQHAGANFGNSSKCYMTSEAMVIAQARTGSAYGWKNYLHMVSAG